MDSILFHSHAVLRKNQMALISKYTLEISHHYCRNASALIVSSINQNLAEGKTAPRDSRKGPMTMEGAHIRNIMRGVSPKPRGSAMRYSSHQIASVIPERRHHLHKNN